jgi:phosphoglycolate phosphatase-like HAD superfamily hydrolase
MIVYRLLSALLLVPTSNSFSTLITFDVDGTLVSSSPGWEEGAHGRAFAHAVDTILGAREDGKQLIGKRTIPELLEKHEFHGSTDGLILLRLARKAFGMDSDAAFTVHEMMNEMYDFVSKCDDDEVAKGIAPLPGVLSTLQTLATRYGDSDTTQQRVAFGLVTGNVEGIARRKMKALSIYDTGVLTPLPQPLGGREWGGVEHLRFLGGFGSDYCSGDIENPERNYLDRGEQLSICVERCIDMRKSHEHTLERVVHVGDAPADILAAKAYVDHPTRPDGLCVSVVGVATGSYSVEELQELCGETIPGKWEPVVLKEGQGVGNEEVFLEACGLSKF